MSSDRSSRKEKNQNIQVFLRLRPINNRERELKSQGVVEVLAPKDVIVKMPPLESKLTKKFSFDKAFGPNSKQVEVYQEVVSPLIEEVLAGYNCTVFAYGQTGTGKTHTMVGESSIDGEVAWQNDPMAGIIPRALSQLFDELRLTNSEFTVRVSYLELYNEELFDLLSSSEDNSKLRIYEDVTRKGSNIVNGLEEVTVYNKNEVYKIMAKGQEKRRIASTLMNAQSSRSHTVFTIVVHMKENSSEGEELMKIGKLNLVDLAGSENISKAGSDNPARKERARECVNINQSLLTLGRVITALVERHPHIPYRESKLTRLLQESLGGRTKTSIIATISPGHRDVEETLSTLDYAYRARCIQNKPEVNQRITKHAVLKEFSEEIDRLKRDLLASREKNGVYISYDTYTDMNMKMDEQSKEIQEKLLHIKALLEEKDKIEKLFNDMEHSLKSKEEELTTTNMALDNAKDVIKVTKKDLTASRMECEEQKELVSKRQATEEVLSEQACKLLKVADSSTIDVHNLQNTIDKKKTLESSNLEKVKGFGHQSQSHRMQMKEQLDMFSQEQSQQLRLLQEALDLQRKSHLQNQFKGKQLTSDLLQKITEAMVQSCCVKEQCVTEYSQFSEGKLNELRSTSEKHKELMEGKMHDVLKIVETVQCERDKMMNSARQLVQFVQEWKDSFNIKIQNVHRVQEEWWQQYTNHMTSLAGEFEQQHNAIVNDVQRTAKERSAQQEDIFSSLKSLRQALDTLEAKTTSSAEYLSTEEAKMCAALQTRGTTFSGALSDGRRSLEETREGVKTVTHEMEVSHAGFLKDITNINADHVDKIKNTANMEGKLTDILLTLPSVYNETWLQQTTAVSEGYRETVHKVTDIVSTQQTHHTDTLNECHSEGSNVMAPMDATLEELNRNVQSDREKVEVIHRRLEAYTQTMDNNITLTDTFESRFLNEEYRLYSPTGNTPERREFSYPKELVATSPHERILKRFRKMRYGIQSPQNLSIINLDQTTEETATPIDENVTQNTDLSNLSSPEHESTNISVQTPSIKVNDSDSKMFLEPTMLPPKATPKASPKHMIKSTSDSDVYSLVHSTSESKENLNLTTTEEKKKVKSKLKPPSQKKALAYRNC